MVRLMNEYVIFALVFFINSIYFTHSNKSTMEGDFIIPKKAVYDGNVSKPKEIEATLLLQKKRRVKRQDAGGKFEDAAEMSNLKLIQTIVQMIRNLFIAKPIGGTSPWHHSVPWPVVELFKDKIGGTLVHKKSKEEQEEDQD